VAPPPRLRPIVAPDWWDDAACSGRGPRKWFTEGTEREAVAICRTCPARTPCLRFAVDNDEQHGVWGGMTAEQRRKLRKLHLVADGELLRPSTRSERR
jgi:WhiB family redox-sensing transcriptional regulator